MLVLVVFNCGRANEMQHACAAVPVVVVVVLLLLHCKQQVGWSLGERTRCISVCTRAC